MTYDGSTLDFYSGSETNPVALETRNGFFRKLAVP